MAIFQCNTASGKRHILQSHGNSKSTPRGNFPTRASRQPTLKNNNFA